MYTFITICHDIIIIIIVKSNFASMKIKIRMTDDSNLLISWEENKIIYILWIWYAVTFRVLLYI